ncbi:MAG: TonB-dependent receptor [Bacteroidia bacterium]|jgi:hypothetical protein
MRSLLILFSLLVTLTAFGQARRHTISGTIKDGANGEELTGATVYVNQLKTGVATNAYGFYALTLPPGKYELNVSYIGYVTQVFTVDISEADKKLNVELKEEKRLLNEAVISADRPDAKNVEQNKMSVIKVDIREVKKIPLLLGEVDIIKAIQLLPGVQAAGDGSSNMIVRGGNIDHNLVLLDEAVVYNPSHVLGFFSTFNGDAVKDFEIYKGGIPAQYGGRLASVLDVRMKDGNLKEYNVTGGIGILSSRLTVEGPVVKDKSSFMISGRRSYFDLFFPLGGDALSGAEAYFGDLNIKLNYTLSDKDRLYFSSYFGRDRLGFGGIAGFGWGNFTTTGRWNHVFSNKLFLNTTFVYSRYSYDFDLNIAENLNFTRSNYINDLNLKVDGSYFWSPKSSVKFGMKQTYYTFEPGKVTPITSKSIIAETKLPFKYAYEQDYYASHILKMGSRTTLEYGARVSIFSNIGSGRSINYAGPGTPTIVQNGSIIENERDLNNEFTNYSSGEIFNTYVGFEPRFNATYLLNSNNSVKVSYNRMFQYMHLIQNISASVGQEFWTPSDRYIKPQQSDQVALGYFKNIKENTIELSAEGYYKWMKNTVEIIPNAQIQDLQEEVEALVVAGEGRAYGIEFFARKQRGKTTGWLGYTLSKSQRRADNIDNGDWYNFRFDRTHYLTAVVSHEFTKRLSVGGNFVFATGEAFTIAQSRTQFFGESNFPSIYYGARNSARFPTYYRLDLSVTLLQKKTEAKPIWLFKKRRFEGSWVFSLYNATGAKNAYSLQYIKNDDGVPVIYKWYLFTFVPSVTYNFKF